MPAPVETTAEYFPFYAKDGRTLFILQAKYGLEGIGFFTNLLRTLCTTPGHMLDLHDQIDHMYAVSRIGITDEAKADAMLDFMADTGKIDKRLWEEARVIYSQDFVDSLTELYRKRTIKPPTLAEAYARYGLKDEAAPETPDSAPETPSRYRSEGVTAPDTPSELQEPPDSAPFTPQSKGSKGEERKEREEDARAREDSFSPRPSAVDTREQKATSPHPSPTASRDDGLTRIENHRGLWNSLRAGPPCKLMAISFTPDDQGACLRTLSAYSDEEIAKAMQNYVSIRGSPEHKVESPYRSFAGFMGRGVEKFVDEADPWNEYRTGRAGESTDMRDQVARVFAKMNQEGA